MNNKYIVIDSSSQNCVGLSTNFKYYLSNSVKFKRIKLLFLALPFSWYLIDNSNNNFIIRFNDGTTKNINLIWCDYDVNWLATTINTLVNYASFNMSFDSSFYKYKINASQNFQILNGSLNSILGFDDNQQWNSNFMIGNNIVNF